MLTQTRL